ncbi:MAG: head-tail connector protein [Candidatus Humimicrobiaceae bacterium]
MAVSTSTIAELTDIRDFLVIPPGQTGKDTLLESLLDTYNKIIEDYLGVTMINTTYTAEKYDGDGTDVLYLDRYPIVSVTTLIVDEVTITSADYLLYASGGKIRLTGSIFTKDYQNISITYSAGHGAARVNMPKPLKNALLTWVARIFKGENVDFSQKFGSSFIVNANYQAMPWDIKQMLDPYKVRRYV